MPRARVNVRYPRPDIKASEKKIHESMTKFTLDTLKTWVLETVDPVPVWSGAARASFLFLAAKAFTSFTINPIVQSRITLGLTEAKSEVIADMRSGEYGWNWESELAHIGIVEDRVGFISAGLRAIKGKTPTLPQPEFTTNKRRK